MIPSFQLGLIASAIRTATGPVSNYIGEVIKRSLQSYYSLDGTAIDSVGGRNIAASSATYTDQADNGGKSMRPNASAAAAATPAFLTKNFTIFGWINVHSAASHYPLGAFNNSSHSECCVLYRDQSGNYAWVFASGGVNRAGAPDIATTLPLNQWLFVAVTYDGTQAIAYLNGVTNGPPSAFSMSIDTPANFQLGDAGVTNTFTDEYDEVGVCNRALTQAEITWLYNGGKRRAFTDFADPATAPGSTLADVKAIFTELNATGGIWDFTNFDSLAANSGTGAPAVVDGNIDMVRDLSGNGNHMVSQGNVAVLRKEGNNYYAEFNGAGGFLRSMNVGSSLGYEMYASTRFTATNTQSSPIGGDVAYQRVAQTILFPADATNIGQAIVWFEAGGTDHYLADPNLYPIANADDRIFGFRIDPSGAKLYTNGVEVASDPRQVTINGKEPMPFGLGVDAQGTNTFQYRRHVGRFFGMVVINKPLNTTQRKTINRYLASRMTKPVTIA